MAVHLTPDELSEALGMSRKEIVRLCVQESIPIYNGRIDKMLFLNSMTASGRRLPEGVEQSLLDQPFVS